MDRAGAQIRGSGLGARCVAARDRRHLLDEAQPQAAAAHRVAVFQQVRVHPLLLIVDPVGRAEILEHVAAAAPEQARVVAGHHGVVGADGAVHGAAHANLGVSEFQRAFYTLRVAPENSSHFHLKLLGQIAPGDKFHVLPMAHVRRVWHLWPR
jgi:hypothetical protein